MLICLICYRNCPIDLKEAITSVVFASPRCADIPELMDVRKHFTAKYGKEFISGAVELRPDCGVNRMVCSYTCSISADSFNMETKWVPLEMAGCILSKVSRLVLLIYFF